MNQKITKSNTSSLESAFRNNVFHHLKSRNDTILVVPLDGVDDDSILFCIIYYKPSM